ncbi:MAG: pyridoxal 5'-phosphate synthase glutaminase subunit PdxT [archaeon]
MRIGVIGVQGAVEEHIDVVNSIRPDTAFWMRKPEEVDAFIIPGGESTTITKLMQSTGLWDLVKNSGKPVLGTCAGMIVLAKEGVGDSEKTGQEHMGLLNCRVNRNAFGRQRESFEAEIDFDNQKFNGVFIRAPLVEEVYAGCKVICKFEEKIVGVEQGNVVGLSFHPELAGDARVHEWFVEKIKNGKFGNRI